MLSLNTIKQPKKTTLNEKASYASAAVRTADIGLYGIRPIIANPLNTKQLILGLLTFLRDTARQKGNVLFRQTVASWEVKPTFSVAARGLDKKGDLRVWFGPTPIAGSRLMENENGTSIEAWKVWSIIDQGIDSVIDSRNNLMTYALDIHGRTVPRQFISGSRTHFGKDIRQGYSVRHQIPGRFWTEEVSKIVSKELRKNIIPVIIDNITDSRD